ncbi:hypothetical protein DNTS_008279 [Danionella cerebrum]|uniref:J domain-containing protein n=1 Tax=Danionella cerebrum TaxID=2873325 RepID=A0A553R6H0_9TELE|nr:hypothetical protein DNTS_008279 [Danionella translucida]TRY97783.1 hypothetical protein DNTS_008279 [Danionella translucida]
MDENMAVHWDAARESSGHETPDVILDSQYHVNAQEALDDFEFLDDEFDLEENEEQNHKTEGLDDDQEEKKEDQGEKCESRSRSGSGKKGKSKKSSTGICEQTQSWTSSVQQKSFLASAKHKSVRRRNQHLHNRARRKNDNQLITACWDFLADCVSPWCISCIHMFVELIISLTLRCGLMVESSGITLYDFGTHMLCKVTDVPGLTQDLRAIVDRIRNSAASFKEKIFRSFYWTRNRFVWSLRFIGAALSAASQMVKYIVGKLAGERGRKWWIAFQGSRVWRKISDVSLRIQECLFKLGLNPESPSKGTEKGQPGEELQRLLALAKIPEEEMDPFNVLGVDVHASESELKRAYRQLAVQVHPDKNKHPGAGEAFKVLRAAWDIVSNPETRREYELKRMAATELSKSMNEFLSKLQDDLKEAMNTMMCTKCEGKHRRFEMDREPAEARFCAECNKWHGAEEGDLWAESSMLGLRITYFAFMDGKVFDITDTHRVPYHISFGSKGSGGASRHRPSSEHSSSPGSPSDLQDFFTRFFQAGSPSDPSSNGGFFPTGHSPHQASGAHTGPSSMFSGPSQTSFFSPGAQRGDPSEQCSEGVKPRRRKKVRKPFQR